MHPPEKDATTIGELHGVRISKFEIHEPERSFITDVKVEQYINRHIQDRNRKAMLANPLRLGWR